MILIVVMLYIIMPNYYVYTSWIETSDNHKIVNVTLDVVVYKNFFSKNLCTKIENDYKKINGKPTELKINLFFSKKHHLKNDSYKTVVFKYTDN